MLESKQDERLTDELLGWGKNYLDITWSDSDTDAKVRGIVLRGMTFLDHIAGQDLSYGESDTATQLLMDYARYNRAGTLPNFARDFQGELLSLHFVEEVNNNGTDAVQ